MSINLPLNAGIIVLQGAKQALWLAFLLAINKIMPPWR